MQEVQIVFEAKESTLAPSCEVSTTVVVSEFDCSVLHSNHTTRCFLRHQADQCLAQPEL